MTTKQYDMFTGELVEPPATELDTEPYRPEEAAAWAAAFEDIDAVPEVYPTLDATSYVTMDHHVAATSAMHARIAELEQALEEISADNAANWQLAHANWQLAMRWRHGWLLYFVLSLVTYVLLAAV